VSDFYDFGSALREFLRGLGAEPGSLLSPPVSTPALDPLAALDTQSAHAVRRFHQLRPDSDLAVLASQVKSPIASRILGHYIEVEIPLLGREMVLDSRVDNPRGTPMSLLSLPNATERDPWPKPPKVRDAGEFRATGHGGSSCPGYLTRFAFDPLRRKLEIPVEVLAFHTEGHNGEIAYSIRMCSEVTGRLSVPSDPSEPSLLSLWGKMIIAIKPDDPSAFGGHSLIELVSSNYIEQAGIVTGWPPRPGEFIESQQPEQYRATADSQSGIFATVKRGRIVFSDEVDEFLQARSRIHTFVVLDENLEPITLDSVNSIQTTKRIGGVRLIWGDERTPTNRVTHYRLYRMDPDHAELGMSLIGGQITGTEYVDRDYDGSKSFAYAVVPATRDNLGLEIQGVGLNTTEILHIAPSPQRFSARNQGVGHLSHRLM